MRALNFDICWPHLPTNISQHILVNAFSIESLQKSADTLVVLGRCKSTFLFPNSLCKSSCIRWGPFKFSLSAVFSFFTLLLTKADAFLSFPLNYVVWYMIFFCRWRSGSKERTSTAWTVILAPIQGKSGATISTMKQTKRWVSTKLAQHFLGWCNL